VFIKCDTKLYKTNQTYGVGRKMTVLQNTVKITSINVNDFQFWTSKSP